MKHLCDCDVKKITLLGRTYFVTSEGTVFMGNGKEMAKFKDNHGYEYIVVRKKGERKKHLVHRLVANAFIDNTDNMPQVNHLDGNKENNKVENLEWVSCSDNQLHSRYSLGNVTGFNDVPVICVETGERYISTRDAWRKTGIGYSHISECINGKRKTAGGHTWKKDRGD